MIRSDYNILVIDDDDIDRENIRRLLGKSKKYSFHIFEAGNITDGLNLCFNGSIDCILLDYIFPEGTGLEFINELKTKFSKNLPAIVILTGQGDEELVVKFLRVGALDYLKKGCLNTEHLEKTIVNSIKRHIVQQHLNKSALDATYMLYHDELTNLANRRKFEETLKQYLQSNKKHNRSALLYCDLDKFKCVNDTMGHIVGDFLLKKVACRLLNSVRKSDFVARLSGDEFAVILDDIHGKHAPGIVASNICKAIAKPFRLKKNIINITISIGIVYIPSNSVDPEELINRADTAMYRAKTTGANGYQFSD